MSLGPYDMTVAEDQFVLADDWWRNLSLNQMRTLEAKYSVPSYLRNHKRMVHQMWEEEGKPPPQEL